MRSIILAVLVPAVLAGQESLQPGDRIRTVKTPGTHELRQMGVVVSASSDSALVRLARNPGTPNTFAVRRLEVARGLRTRGGEGALIGIGLGGVAGFALGFAAGEDCTSQTFLCFSRQDTGVMGAVAGVALGALVGGIAGRFTKTDRWVKLVPGR